MFTYLNPDVKFVSRNMTRSDVIKFFAREKEKLKCFLESFPGRVAFTSDCWTSLNTNGEYAKSSKGLSTSSSPTSSNAQATLNVESRSD